MSEYFIKMVNEHPLLVFIEDPFAIFDFKGHKYFGDKIKKEKSGVTVNYRALFKEGGIRRFRGVTIG
jgi:enolase